jgi:type II secretory pathway pseudopilin PulG
VLAGCLLVIVGFAVISFIGIVAAVAIPQFIAARERAFDVAAQEEIRRLMLAQEAYRVENGTYAWNETELDFQDDPEVTSRVLTAAGDFYSMCASHPRSQSSWWVDSDRGEIERRWHTGC